ncbi:MAG: SAM-dependent methyltransferase [Anaeromyxobacteraceae bacterium]|nr:SAM-dependent methyltransferase [Anaeromyxobacteraceae bacterium]
MAARPLLASLGAALALAACQHGAPAGAARPKAHDPVALVAAADRTEADRALDAGRHPAEFLAFLDLRPGMKVADLGAGGGYTTELLARAVSPGGVVYGQNNQGFLRFVGEAWAARLARPVMQGVVRVDREFDAPLPPEASGLDAVVMNVIYHDTIWLEVDRAAMNRAIFAALRPGGAFVIVDSSARPGSGAADVKTLHRVDEALVRAEVEAAGFRLVAEGPFLRNPDDARDWNAAPPAAAASGKRGTSDRFVLRFVRP